MTWTGRRVAVSGANGFIGSWLTARLLEEGAEVVALLAERIPQSQFERAGLDQRATQVPGVLEDRAAVDRLIGGHGVDTVFHLGAQTLVGVAHDDPLQTFEANIRGTYLLLDACRRSPHVQRVVVASSDKAYGASDRLPYREDEALRGVQPYEVSKTCTDLLAQTYALTYELPVAVARCGNVYGGGDLNWSRIVPGTMRSLLQGEVPVIRSDGSLIRDYLHVDDAVEAYLALAGWLDRPDRGADPQIAFNFSDESPRSVLDLYEAIVEVFGTRVEPRVLGEAHAEIAEQHLDASRAKERLGWKASVSLVDGLERTLAWYAELVRAA
jgi:CDP-glucose 4,6-dehydratase